MRRRPAITPPLPCRPRRQVLRAGAVAVLAAAWRPTGAGIPPASLPRLIRLQDELVAIDAGQLQLAIQLDERAARPRGAPVLVLAVHPAVPGAFRPVDERLAMQAMRTATLPAGLPPAGANRAWLAWVLGAESRRTLAAAQSRVRELQAMWHGRDHLRVALSVDQHALLPEQPALSNTRWEAWLQSAQGDGWYPIWTGTVRELAEESRAQS